MRTTKQIGNDAEDLAVDYLSGQGYEIIERNFNTKLGEIDIIALDGDTLMFVEVKKKNSDRFGTPGEMITVKKLGKIRRTAEYYLLEKNLSGVDWRIDAVLLEDLHIEHIKNITI